MPKTISSLPTGAINKTDNLITASSGSDELKRNTVDELLAEPNADISALQTENAEQDTEISALQTENAELKAQITEMEEQISELNSKTSFFDGKAYEFDASKSLLSQIMELSNISFVAGIWNGYQSEFASEMPEDANYYVIVFTRNATYKNIIAFPDYGFRAYNAKMRGSDWEWRSIALDTI